MPAPSTHESLLLELACGERREEAWAVFCERYGALILDFGRFRGLQASDREDLLQDVLLSLTKALPGFRYDPAKGRLRSYLKAVTSRTLSRRISQKPTTIALEEVGEPQLGEEDAWEEAWRRHHVRRALARLRREVPERALSAFELYALEGRPAEETAELLGIPVAHVYQAKSRILPRVKALVAEQVAAEG